MTYSSVATPKAQTDFQLSSQNLSATKLTEANATKLLEQYLYTGCGRKYLGWRFPEYRIEPDGTDVLIKSDGCRVWQFEWEEPPQWWKQQRSADKHFLDYIQPLWLHLKGCFRGLVVDSQTTHVPLIAIDPDRHTGTPTDEFILWVQEVADIFEAETSAFRLSAEVNPKNGSAKFFAWPKDGKPLSLDDAKQIAERIHDRVVEETGKGVEVFPHNMPNLRLPLHPEKVTIIGSGLLGKTIRKKGREKQEFEAHSVVEFVKWIVSGENYDRDLLLNVLRDSCANLPDEPVEAEVVEGQNEFVPESVKPVAQGTCPRQTRSARPAAGSGRRPEHVGTATPVAIQKLQAQSNSWIRQRDALLIACRKAKRVLAVEEALDFIHQHKLYTGDWSENEQRRFCRVQDILKIIAQTFDPKKCSAGKSFDIDVSKFRKFTRSFFPSAIQTVKHRGYVRDTGEMQCYCRYVTATNDDIACWMAISEFCRKTSEHGDGGVPEERAEKIWRLLHETGKVVHNWSVERWRLIRDFLHQRGVVTCNYVADRDKAYCYQAGPAHPGAKVKRARIGLPGSYRNINKKKKTEEPNTEGVDTLRSNRLSSRNHDLIRFRFAERGPPCPL